MENIFFKKQILFLWAFACMCHITLTNELHAPLPKHEKRVKKAKKKLSGAKKAFVGVGALAAAVGFAYWCSQQRGTPSADIPEYCRPSNIMTPGPSTSPPIQVNVLVVKNKVYHALVYVGLSIMQPDSDYPNYLVSVLKKTDLKIKEKYENVYKNSTRNEHDALWVNINKQIFQLNESKDTLIWKPELKYDDYELRIYPNDYDEYQAFITQYKSKTPLDILLTFGSKIKELEYRLKNDPEEYAKSREGIQNTLIEPIRATLSQTQLLLYDSKSRRGRVGEMFAIHPHDSKPRITEFQQNLSSKDQTSIVEGKRRIIVSLSFDVHSRITVFGTIIKEDTNYQIIEISHQYQFNSYYDVYFPNIEQEPKASKFRT